jgi:hypothetical protein
VEELRVDAVGASYERVVLRSEEAVVERNPFRR